VSATPRRWYQVPLMWLVVGLPLLSCVGGLAMVVVATVVPDTEVHSDRIEAGPPEPTR
jgi:hypothetical protein